MAQSLRLVPVSAGGGHAVRLNLGERAGAKKRQHLSPGRVCVEQWRIASQNCGEPVGVKAGPTERGGRLPNSAPIRRSA